ncbi:YaiI/YqxD family protein [Shouchella clausii]|uniref:YaiI/YqxD family protein n=1 Tax=Shouchella clausii TaxID=79880 RepID=UPI00214747DF|nr:DUF188 domain-containing protein [Shouchella clausii]MCR1286877.1 DUF188 domain-containing protein [Shouchella clausii]
MVIPSNTTVYVDADSCPVKEEVISLARTFGKKMVFVYSYAHTMSLPKDVETAIVDTSKEAADLYLLQSVNRGDVCVTQDHALASLLLVKGVIVLSPRGHVYKEEEMPAMLAWRHTSQKARRAGEKTRGPKKFTASDRAAFYHALYAVLEKIAKE